ncbi:MAG: MFS transporter [Nitrospinae bacterium]|nr:MFS transporter [Nitrospinota bacterium]
MNKNPDHQKTSHGREVFSWCMYDFANSAFPTLIVTVAYSVYFKTVVAGGGGSGDFLWGVSLALAMILSVTITPPLSAVADRRSVRKRFLILFAYICVLTTALLGNVTAGMIFAGMALFIIATAAFESSLIFYNSFLPDVSTPKTIGKVSGWGWGLGYLGGLFCLFLVKPLLEGGFSPENLPLFRMSFVAVAGFYGLFTIPLIFWLRESKTSSTKASEKSAFAELWITLRDTKQTPGALKFLVAFFLYNDGIVTVISFSSIYAVSTLNFSMGEVLSLFIMVQVSAGIGAFTLGYLTDAWGPRKTILLTLVNWCVVVIVAYFTVTKYVFLGVSLLAGLSLGSSQSASRALMARYIPERRAAQSFSFYGICGKMSSVLGPLVFGGVSALTGDQRTAILSVLAFFLVGGALLWLTPETRKSALTDQGT